MGAVTRNDTESVYRPLARVSGRYGLPVTTCHRPGAAAETATRDSGGSLSTVAGARTVPVSRYRRREFCIGGST